MYHNFDSRALATTSDSIPIERLSYFTNSQRRLPAILTLDGLDEFEGQANYGEDLDQKVSEQLRVVEPSHMRPYAMSMPDYFPPPLTTSFSDGDLSVSPAAMFLSAFSPSCPALPDDEGQVVAGYRLGPIVGHGGFSIIRTASSPSGGTVAIKIVRRIDTPRSELEREVQVWASLHHEHILPLFTTEHTSYADYFITQYCPAGSLFDILKRDGQPAMPQDNVGTMFRQVVRGLQYMHEVAGYVHGDIKLENVLIDEMGVCKIADFGMARKIGEINQQHVEQSRLTRKMPKQGLHTHLSLIRHTKGNHSRTTSRHRNSTPVQNTLLSNPTPVYQQGSLPYASPELLLPHIESPYLPNPAQDIWALGVLLYTLLTGRLPFVDSFEPRLQMKILHGVFEMPKGIGRSAERVLQGCMETSVPARWTISMVDEVGWGIGWGEAGDSATPPDDEDETPCNRSRNSTSAIASRSRSRQRGERRYSPLPDSASRRCGNRSLSRSPSTSRSTSRDRVQYIPPSLSSLTASILGATLPSSSHAPSSSRSSSTENDRDRGRTLTKSTLQLNSRSPSPSLAPMTPTDSADSRLFLFPMKSRINSNELSPDSGGYGRGRIRGANRVSPHFRDPRTIAELADIEEHSGWSVPSHEIDRDWAATLPSQVSLPIKTSKGPRAGSLPPQSSDLRETSWSHCMLVPTPRRAGVRSKSVGFKPERLTLDL